MNIAEVMTQQAQENPDAIAIIDTHRGRERRTTFAELESLSARGATLFGKLGLKEGDAVLVLQPMSLELYGVLVAIFRLGLVAVVIDPSAGRAHLARCCKLYPPDAFIASPKAHLLRLLFPALKRIPLKLSTSIWLPGAVRLKQAKGLTENSVVLPLAADAPALVTFTSGSTGQPKAAVRSHGFLIAQHRALATSLELQMGEMDLSTLPIFVLANLASGVTSLIPNANLTKPGAVKVAPIEQQLERLKPDRLSASPAFLTRIVEHYEQSHRSLPYLNKVFTGGAPVFPNLLERAQTVFPGAYVAGVYGSTEAEPIAHIAWHNVNAHDKTAMRAGRGLLTGAPVPDIQLRILEANWEKALSPLSDAAFAARCQAPGEVGEIVVSGDHVLKGYLNGVGDEETKFSVNGTRWHRTGDVGYLDRTGRLWLLGRASAVIRDARGTLYPFAVECAAQMPELARVAVVSHKERRLLLLEPRPGHTANPSGLRERLAWAQLDDFKTLQIPVDKRHNAKVDYPQLHKLLERLN